MKGNPGDSVICINAPWHERNSSLPCGIKGFGPHKNELVTIDFLLIDENENVYFRIKEYPDNPNDVNFFAGFRNDFFEPLMSDKKLEDILPHAINETRKS